MQRMAKFSQEHSHLFQASCYSHGDGYVTTSWLPPHYLTSLSMYTVLLLREVKPKSFDDLEIVKVADRRLAAKRRVIVLSFGL